MDEKCCKNCCKCLNVAQEEYSDVIAKILRVFVLSMEDDLP